MTATKAVFDVGEAPPLGIVPERMHAQTIRQGRYGDPASAFADEVVPVPSLGPDDVLVYVMAAGVNFNSVWAALGVPVDVVGMHKRAGDGGDEAGFHIGGSDAAGVVYAVGESVMNVKAGDEVVVAPGHWDPEDPFVKAGGDSCLSNGFGVWGFDTNWGSYAQFTRVRSHQCLPKPPNLTWDEAASFTLVAGTAYRMLCSWPPNTVQPGDPVLIWGGSGGLGSMAIQIVKALGGVPVAVVSSEERGAYCVSLGAKGYIDRTKFEHWGRLSDWTDDAAMGGATKGFRDFGRAFWDVLGERRGPRIVFEHPGQDTLPTSTFICDTGGMVVICAGTSGYNGDVDLRYLWTRAKRLQGTHLFNRSEAEAVVRMAAEGQLNPCLGRAFAWHEIGEAHRLMQENRHPNGNMAVLVGAPRPGLK